jgi:hypothetical protein
MANREFNESEQPSTSENGRETALASEPSLSKDWLLREEDEAWESL